MDPDTEILQYVRPGRHMGGGLVALTSKTGRLRFKRPEVALLANNRTWNEIQIFNISQFVKPVPKLSTVNEENENDRNRHYTITKRSSPGICPRYHAKNGVSYLL